MATYLVIRDGQIKLRLPGAQLVGGKLTAPTIKGPGYVVDGDLAKADGVYKKVAGLAKASRYAEIDPKYLAGPGISASGLRVISESEWRAERDAAMAAQLWARQLDFSRDNHPVIVHDERDDLGGEVELTGCRWRITRIGQPFDRGVHRVRYGYAEFIAITDGPAAHQAMARLLLQEKERYRREFDRMMLDGDNDGVNPPRPMPAIIRDILDRVHPTDAARERLRAKVRKQAASDPSGALTWLMRQAGERAQALFDAGAPEAEILAALQSYEQDPGYADAAWGD